jgi:hypothetical protein
LEFPEAGEEKMVFLDILSAEQTLLRPEKSVGGVLVSFYNDQSRGANPLGLDIFPSRRDGLILSALYVKLGDKLQNFAPFLATTTFPFTFTCQPSYLLFQRDAVILVTKAVPIIADLVRKRKRKDGAT